MCEERVVVVRRGPGATEGGLGVSLLGEAGPAGPHVIYRVERDSPAARSGQVEAGDVILKVNGTDVDRFSTREVLKCLRLSGDPVTLRIKRDPAVAASVRRLTTERHNHDRSPPSSSSTSSSSSSGAPSRRSGSSSEQLLPPSPPPPPVIRAPKFEAFTMTGDLILKLSRHEHNSASPHLPPYHRYNSTPVSPVERERGAPPEPVQRYNSSPAAHNHRTFNSTPASPGGGGGGEPVAAAGDAESTQRTRAVRTSRSEDHLQKEWCGCGTTAEPDDDVTSSLHTLLDTRRPDTHRTLSTSNSDETEQRSSSPASPTSMSSSVMSSRATPTPHHRVPPAPQHHRNMNGDVSLSEAMSNISSPDYQDPDDAFESGRECARMELSDPSDSDSTILVSEPCHRRRPLANGHADSDRTLNGDDHRIVIQVKGPEKQNGDVAQHNGDTTPDTVVGEHDDWRCEPESVSDEGSDAESLHSFHYSPKAVDLPSAVRLAKRLYHLDGFKKSDVSRHLSKNNEFSRAVAEEYVKHFSLHGLTLDVALRTFLARFALGGETQERERVLVHFSRRYLECNPGAFRSQDAVHTLTCALMLLNTDLHGSGASFRRMACSEFVDNLAELNDGGNFPRDVLERLYKAIRAQPLAWAADGEAESEAAPAAAVAVTPAPGGNPFLDVPDPSRAVEYKKGYVMRKCCYDANAKKTPFGKRGWKMFYCTLRDLVLHLHKDDRGAGDMHNAIRIHHALATRASDYTKKQHVFRLHTADRAEYLFQTSDSKELTSWVDTINLVCATHSAPPLAGGVGSQRKFQRPLLPCSHTKLAPREQLQAHDERVAALEAELAALKGSRDSTPHARDKEQYLIYELKRYRTYATVMRARAGETPPPPPPEHPLPPPERPPPPP